MRLSARLAFLWLLAALPLQVYAQAIVVRSAPPNAAGSTTIRFPSGLPTHAYLRGHMILTAADLAAVPSGTTLKSLGMVYLEGTSTPAGGNFRVYLQNSADLTNQKSSDWATAIGPMTEVYAGGLSLPVGTAPATLDLPLTTSFTYSGGSLYMAYEYTATTFASDVNHPAKYAANFDMAGSIRMDASTSALPTTLTQVSAFRPQLRLGFPNPHQHELSLESLGVTYGELNGLWDSEVFVTVANSGALDAADVPVALVVTGANAGAAQLSIASLAAGGSAAVSQAWENPLAGAQTITASIPSDEVPSNNELSIAQDVGCSVLSYAGSATPYDGIGFNTGSGISAVRYTTPTVPVLVKRVFVDLYNAPTSLGKTIAAKLLDDSGTIVGTSEPFVIGAEHLGARVWLELTTPVQVAPGTRVFAGILQTAGTPGYFPVATVAPAAASPDRVYSFDPDGTNKTEYTTLGTLKIGFEADPVLTLQVGDEGHGTHGEPVAITATPGYASYAFLINGAAAQSGASNVLTYLAEDQDIVSVTAIRGPCDTQVETEVSMVIPDKIFTDGFDPLVRRMLGAGVGGGAVTAAPSPARAFVRMEAESASRASRDEGM